MIKSTLKFGVVEAIGDVYKEAYKLEVDEELLHDQALQPIDCKDSVEVNGQAWNQRHKWTLKFFLLDNWKVIRVNSVYDLHGVSLLFLSLRLFYTEVAHDESQECCTACHVYE